MSEESKQKLFWFSYFGGSISLSAFVGLAVSGFCAALVKAFDWGAAGFLDACFAFLASFA